MHDVCVSGMDGGMVGLSLTYAMTLMMMFQWMVRQSSEVESLVSYRTLNQEPTLLLSQALGILEG